MTDPTDRPSAETGTESSSARDAEYEALLNPTRQLPLPQHPHTEQAARSLMAIGQMFARDLTAEDMLDCLRSALYQDGDGEAMLFSQAQVLDKMFHRLTVNALSAVDESGAPIRDYIDEKRVNLMLRTQKQCRTTIEARNTIRDRIRAEREHEKQKKYEQTEGW